MKSTAKEMMTTDVKSIGPDCTIKEAAAILNEFNISGLPVVNEDKKVIGIVSSSDIVKFSGQMHIVTLVGAGGWVSPYADVTAMSTLSQGFELLGKKLVKEIMTKRVVTVGEDASVEEVAKLLAKKKINRMPVVDAKGGLVGIITRRDLIAAIAE